MFKILSSVILFVSIVLSQNSQEIMEPDFVDVKSKTVSGGQSSTEAAVDFYWEWTGDPQWLTTVSLGIYEGQNFISSSTVDESNLVPVRIVFSSEDTTYAQTYRRDLDYVPGGVGIFRGSAWDISNEENPRRLNMCLVEWEDGTELKPPNLLWDPDQSGTGAREYIFVMSSDYDGNGLTYDDENWGPGADKLFGCWFRVADGHSLYEADPSEINIYLNPINGFSATPGDKSNLLEWFVYDFFSSNVDQLKLYYGLSSPANTLVTTLPSNTTSYLHSGLTNNTQYFYRIEALNGLEVVAESEEIVSKAQKMSDNMTLLGNLNLYSNNADIWGYTDSLGNEYALLCAQGNGLSIIDINTMPPTEVGFVPSIGPGYSDSKDVKVYGNYAFLINELRPIQIIDLTDPSNPQQVQTITLLGDEENGAHNCYIENGYLYVVGNHFGGWLEIYDITNPLSPLKVGDFYGINGNESATYYHDVYVRNDTAFAAGIQNVGVDIIDVSSKEEPSLIATYNYPGNYTGAHNVWTTEDGKYLFVGDEVGDAGNHTRVLDISDTENIEYVADIIVDPMAITHNCYVVGDYLYIGHYTEGVRVYNISNPESPYEVAYYDTYPPSNYGFDGVWSVYPFFQSGKIIASDRQTGLYVLEMDENPTEIKEKPKLIPTSVELYQNYPNPFNPSTQISFYLPRSENVTLKIYDALGKEVDQIYSGNLKEGYHPFTWIANEFAAGVYFYQLKGEGFSLTKKLLLIK